MGQQIAGQHRSSPWRKLDFENRGLHPRSETNCILTVCRERRTANGSKVPEVQPGVPGIGAAPFGAGTNVAQLCRELGISRQLLYLWREDRQRQQQKQFQNAEQRLRQENTQLRKALVKKTWKWIFEGCLRKGRGSTPDRYRSGEMASGKLSGNDATADSLGIEPMCRLARSAAPDSTVFSNLATPAKRRWKCATPSSRSSSSIAAATATGASPLSSTAAAWPVNHKRVLRLMHETTCSASSLRRSSHHPVGPRLGGLPEPGQAHEADRDQPVMVADITYIRLRQEFVYLAVVLDAFSRKVVGWALDRTLTARLPLLVSVGPSPCANRRPDWCTTPIGRAIRLRAVHADAPRPRHPAQHEPSRQPLRQRLLRKLHQTLKREQIYAHTYQYIDELSAHLEEFIDHYYNRLRLHSALGYKTRRSSKLPAPHG